MSDHKPNAVDEELLAAQKSMGGRIDADEPVVPEPKVDEKEKEVPPTPVVEEPKPPVVPPVEPPKDPPVDPLAGDKKPIITRPEAYIPLPKYHDEKKAWETEKADFLKKIADLEAKGPTATTSTEDAIAKFAEKHTMDPSMVEELVTILESKLLPADKAAKIDEALKLADSAKQTEQTLKSIELFKEEFKEVGMPKLSSLYPKATPEQLEAARTFLDAVAHSAGFNDKSLTDIISFKQDDLSKIFTLPDDTTPPTPSGNKTMESSRPGNGKQATPTAADFKGKTDFTDFLALDQPVQDEIRKSMDNETYQAFVSFMGNKENGVEVMRNGRKVVLK